MFLYRRLLKFFYAAVKKFRVENPIETDRLGGDLLEWTSAVCGDENLTTAQILERQINHSIGRIQSQGKQVTPQEYVDGLFSKNPKGELTADIIMGRLQLG